MTENKEFLQKNRIGKKQEIAVIVELKSGEIMKIHNSYIYQPGIHFEGGSIKWHEDVCGK